MGGEKAPTLCILQYKFKPAEASSPPRKPASACGDGCPPPILNPSSVLLGTPPRPAKRSGFFRRRVSGERVLPLLPQPVKKPRRRRRTKAWGSHSRFSLLDPPLPIHQGARLEDGRTLLLLLHKQFSSSRRQDAPRQSIFSPLPSRIGPPIFSFSKRANFLSLSTRPESSVKIVSFFRKLSCSAHGAATRYSRCAALALCSAHQADRTAAHIRTSCRMAPGALLSKTKCLMSIWDFAQFFSESHLAAPPTTPAPPPPTPLDPRKTDPRSLTPPLTWLVAAEIRKLKRAARSY